MNCTPAALEAAEYCENREDERGGIKQLLSIFLHQDVETYPAYKTDATVGPPVVTEMEACLRAHEAIVMKTGKFPVKLPTMMEKVALKTTDLAKGGYLTELTVVIQNTAHNRGFVKNIKGQRFTLAAAEEDGDMLLLGQSNGQSTGYLCKVKKNSLDEEYGVEFDNEKMIQFVIECKPFKPVVYPFPIAYE